MTKRQTRLVASNESIFSEGAEGDCAYLIERGRVLIYLNKEGTEIPLKIIGEGEVFGEMSLIDNTLRSASCRALVETQLIVVTREQLLQRIQVADPVVRLLMRALLERLRFQNDAIRGKKSGPTGSMANESLEKEKREALERIHLENKIAASLEQRKFIPYYQPIFDLHTGELKGAEALMRWISDDGTILTPSAFVDIMEHSALILDAGRLMMEGCMRDLAQYNRQFKSRSYFFVSINISGRQFASAQFLEQLESIRRQHGIEANQIKLEVTERVMMEGPLALATLQHCRSLGYQLAIDDFGTGFSSLQYLASMPLNDLKIDRSFVVQMLTQERSMSLIKALIHMAQVLGINLIAEGIETAEQRAILQNLGVQQGQGFLFSKPVPFSELLNLPPQIRFQAA